MKYRYIKDLKGLGLFTVGKIYETIERTQFKGITTFCVINNYGRESNFSDKTLPKYFEKVEDQ